MRRVLAGVLVVYAVAFLMTTAPQSSQMFGFNAGRDIFRYDTFGDEQLWTDELQLHTAVQNLRPVDALAAGLKVDVQALPREVIKALEAGEVDLTSPAVTRLLLSLNAVVGVMARISSSGSTVETIGITC